MKIRYLSTILFLAVLMLIIGCKESAEFRDVLLLTGTENSPTVKFTVDGPQAMAITVTSTKLVDRDIKVRIELDTTLLNEYNEKMGSNFKSPPSDSYTLTKNDIIIQKNKFVSEQSELSISSLSKFIDGVNYCIPIKIVSTDGDVPVLEASRKMFIVIKRIVTTRALNLAGRVSFNVPSFMNDNSLKSLMSISMECRVKINSFPGEDANPGISSLIGIEEQFLLRFGDISIKKNQLQLAPAVIAGKKFFTTGETAYTPGKWYHVAVVYDGSSVSLYVNGKLDVRFAAGPGGVDLTNRHFNGFWIGQSERGRYLDGAISEVRVWKRALSMAEIEENMCIVNPTAEGLLAYWRFNEIQSDNSVLDLTGNGHKAVPNSYITNFPNFQYEWVEGVKCP